MVKRAFDVTVVILGLTLMSPLLLVCAGIMLWAEGFPILFRQVRVGAGGRPFVIYKLNTMVVSSSSREGSFGPGRRDRITRIGGFLRSTKLDEWPQLWNVLKGDMSLVGPRPEIRKWVDAYPERWAKVLTVRPGMTDPASIMYRNEEELLAHADDPEAYYRDHILLHKLELYEAYVVSRSFRVDMCLIVKTILSILLPGRYSLCLDSSPAGKDPTQASQ